MSKKDKINNFLSGPVNLVRMEGSINNKKKVFYFFMDIHNPIGVQSECEDLRSVYINQYFIYMFDKLKQTDKKIDFFLETFPDISNLQTNRTGIYLNQLRNMFEKIYDFDYAKNKVVTSKQFPNVRMHYMDIRSYFTFKVGAPFGIISELSDFVYNYPNKEFQTKDIALIKNIVNIIDSQLKIIYDIFYSKNKDNKKVKVPIIRKFKKIIEYKNDVATKAIKYLVHKIKSEYENDKIKGVINEILTKDLMNLFHRYIEILNKITTYLENNDSVNQFINIYSYFETFVINIFTLIMDVYFLRRSLDKEYVKTSICYTGAFHSVTYIAYLVKYFDFRVTHVAHTNTNSLQKLNSKIKSSKNIYDVEKLFLDKDRAKMPQCIDMTKFPDNFN
jgi:hypothetical protein